MGWGALSKIKSTSKQTSIFRQGLQHPLNAVIGFAALSVGVEQKRKQELGSFQELLNLNISQLNTRNQAFL